MKKASLLFTVISILFCACSGKNNSKQEAESNNLVNTHIVVAYVTSWSSIMPDPSYITHINYAFGHVNESFNGVRIDNEPRLTSIVDIKKNNPELKIMLSIGGWESGRFSEMAADAVNRKAFADDCKRVVDKFGLDGIDIDWEYPTSNEAGISFSPDDTGNFTLLMRDIREAIGDDKLLTLASSYLAEYIDFKAINNYVDFVNIMTYDMGRPPYHNAPLYKSVFTRNLSADQSVDAHVAKGIPLSKLTLGMPFYGRGIEKLGRFINYKDISSIEGYTHLWDSVAQVSYIVDDKDSLIFSYDDERSLKIKCEYILQKEMLGAMYWDYDGDDDNGTLRKTVYNTVMGK